MTSLWLRIAARLSLVLSLASGIPAKASEISLVGTGDGLDILRAIGDAFQKKAPNTNIQVPASIGSGGAIVAVGAGRERIGRVARPLTPAEEASGLSYHPVAKIPTAFYLHPGLGNRKISLGDLRRIFAGEVMDWAELGGTAQRIRVVRREDADSSIAVMRSTLPGFQQLRFTDRAKIALTTQEALLSVRENAGAIGFAPYSVMEAQKLGVVAVDGVPPDHLDYPAVVTLALIYRVDRLDPELKDFIAFFDSKAAHDIMRSFGARPARP
ncbi:MAG: substrate-binding domain-containing protein [Proteobacteria bacterium]|nr:substrate-binding domain-containing protein [Pseudomonadota bacterium]